MAKRIRCFFVWATAFAVILSTLSACNTVKGIGKDIRSLGSAIERSASGGK
jgi:predicted small secreted protein